VKRIHDRLVQTGTVLSPPFLEAEFRESVLDRERTIAKVLAWAVILFRSIGLLLNEYLLAGTAELPVSWAFGLVMIAASAAFLLFLRGDPGVAAFDRALFVWSVVVFGAHVAGNTLLPASYVAHVAWDLLIALGIYVVIPLSFTRQAATALLFSLAGVLVASQMRNFLHPSALPDILTAYVCANGVGIVASLELHRTRRRNFLSLTEERRAREKLEAAHAEIRTLQGIIPICAVCKHVKTDIGEWEMLEEYVRDRSDADFSHGICPDCARTLYPVTEEEA
jgi:hypothetical protein